MNITFIFNRCHRSWAVVASVKCKCDSNNLKGTFARSTFLLTKKLTNGTLVTPTSDAVVQNGEISKNPAAFGELTHCDPATEILHDDTKPLPEPMFTYHQQCPVTFIWGQFSHIILYSSITKMSLKITYLKLHSDLTGANSFCISRYYQATEMDLSVCGPFY